MNSQFLTLTKPSSTIPSLIHHNFNHKRPSLLPCGSTTNDTENSPPQPIIPPETVKIRFRRGSRRRSREKLKQDESSSGVSKKTETPKDWETMTFTEKAIELYVGEKGLLFWLNKFAYASIFIIIGAWVLFRFVGPALNLYQLDSAPLPPAAMFKG